AIPRVQSAPGSVRAGYITPASTPKEKRFAPVVYHAQVEGTGYASLREDVLKAQIDRSLARRDQKEKGKKEERIAVNDSLYLVPKAAVQAGDAVNLYLEWETQRRDPGHCRVW